MVGRIVGVTTAVLAGAALLLSGACGKSDTLGRPPPSSQTPDGGSGGSASGSGGGTSDGGAGNLPDAGGQDDAGTVIYDAGTIVLPNTQGWQFFGPQNGGPREVLGVTSDAAGNIWVAGGDEGLFLLLPGSATFRRFTVSDGLTGYNDGAGIHAQRVLSVAGGPANTVFVGYQGLPGCQDAFERYTGAPDPQNYHPDPAHQYIWKSGDADRVVWTGTGLTVSHYDISSAAGVVAAEPMGREKLCTIYRIAYHGKTNSVWFGANHGVAWGDPNGTRVVEHTHPSINGYVLQTAADGGTQYHYTLITDSYFGLSVQRDSGALWLGGANRSAFFPCTSDNFWTCDDQIQKSKIDLWPDAVAVDSYPEQRTDDDVSDMAALDDGSVWVSSVPNGLVHWSDGHPEYLKETSVEPHSRATSLELDPSDGSLWIGFIWGGVSHLKGGHIEPYTSKVFGEDVVSGPVPDIQSDTYSGHRRILVAFQGGNGKPGVVGIYTGP